ncbi:MAG: polysaccharide deacetylase family protein [Solirubrobacteraceae bacterium]
MQDLALTFDDGPDRTGTPQVLDALAAASARATFFVIAPRACAHPALVARIAEEGHGIGLHCDEHVRHSKRDLDWGRADTDRALERLTRLGVSPKLWRTPWGDTAPWTEPLAAEYGLSLTGWTVDTHDWRGDAAPAMFAATREGLRAGAIVLAHDGLGPGARREDVRETVAYIELATRHARANNLKLIAMG